VPQAAGKPHDLQRATFYDIDANAVTCANLSAFSGAHSDIRHLEMLWTVVAVNPRRDKALDRDLCDRSLLTMAAAFTPLQGQDRGSGVKSSARPPP